MVTFSERKRKALLIRRKALLIGFDSSRAFTKSRTGTENYSYQLLLNLAKIDHKNEYLVYLRPLATKVENLGGWPENFTFKTLNWPRFWTQGGLALQTLKDNLDVLFVPAHTLPLIHKPGLKTVVTVHDLGSEYLPQMHQLKQRLYLALMQKYQLKSATKLIAVSNATKEDLIKKIEIDPNKVKVIYEGYNSKLYRPIKGDVLVDTLREYDLVPGGYFLFVGTVQPRKNLERLIRAFAQLFARGLAGEQPHRASSIASLLRLRAGAPRSPSPLASKLVIIGSKGWLSEDIYKLPKKLGVEDKVKFLGYVPDEKMPALYSGALALTFPSLFEGFGLPILEAQACGCPVLTSNISSMPEVGGPPVGGGVVYVDPYSVEDIIRGIREIGEVRGKLIKAGFENIKRFSWEKCARETLEVLENS